MKRYKLVTYDIKGGIDTVTMFTVRQPETLRDVAIKIADLSLMDIGRQKVFEIK